MGISIFDRIHDSLGEQTRAVVLLGQCFRMHPIIWWWPSKVFYRGRLLCGLEDPMRDRPLVKGLPWALWTRGLPGGPSGALCQKLADAKNISPDELHSLLDELHGPALQHGNFCRVLLVDNWSYEVSSTIQKGFGNIPKAATAVDLVYAVMPDILQTRRTVRVAVGYELQVPPSPRRLAPGHRALPGLSRHRRARPQGQRQR